MKSVLFIMFRRGGYNQFFFKVLNGMRFLVVCDSRTPIVTNGNFQPLYLRNGLSQEAEILYVNSGGLRQLFTPIRSCSQQAIKIANFGGQTVLGILTHLESEFRNFLEVLTPPLQKAPHTLRFSTTLIFWWNTAAVVSNFAPLYLKNGLSYRAQIL